MDREPQVGDIIANQDRMRRILAESPTVTGLFSISFAGDERVQPTSWMNRAMMEREGYDIVGDTTHITSELGGEV